MLLKKRKYESREILERERIPHENCYVVEKIYHI